MVLCFVAITAVVTVMTKPTYAVSLKGTGIEATQQINNILNPIVRLTTPQLSSPESLPPASTSNNSASNTPAMSASPVSQSLNTANLSAPSVTAQTGIQALNEPVALETIRPIDNENILIGNLRNSKFANVILKSPVGSSSQSDFGWLQATESGWRLFGVAWYWWFVSLAAGISAFVWREKPLQIIVSKYHRGQKANALQGVEQ